jgi:hypothetical protein
MMPFASSVRSRDVRMSRAAMCSACWDDPPVRWQHSCGDTLSPMVICSHCGNEARMGAHSPTGRGTRTT